METQKISDNLFSQFCQKYFTNVDNLKNFNKSRTLRMIKLMSYGLLTLSMIHTASASISSELISTEHPRYFRGNARYYPGNTVIIGDVKGDVHRVIAKCYPASSLASASSDKNLICLKEEGVKENLFRTPNGHNLKAFNVPENLFQGGDKREAAMCKIFGRDITYSDGARKSTEAAFYRCERNAEESHLRHAAYYLSELYKHLTSGDVPHHENGFSCSTPSSDDTTVGRDLQCFNDELMKHFFTNDEQAGDAPSPILQQQEVAQKVAKDISYIENKDGTVKPWPFYKAFHMERGRRGRFLIDADLCQLNDRGADILGAKYTCAPSILASAIATISGPLGCSAILLGALFSGAYSLAQSWWSEHKLTKSSSKIINPTPLDRVKALRTNFIKLHG